MAFLDKLSNMTKNIADKASDTMEITKLNSKISGEKSKIMAAKTQIGEYYWAKFESGAILDADVIALCTEIRACGDAIELLEQEIQKIKAEPPPAADAVPAVSAAEGIPCAACGAILAQGKKFCPECGAPVQVAAAYTETAPVIRCSGCGEELPAGKKFCPECGAPVGEPIST